MTTNGNIQYSSYIKAEAGSADSTQSTSQPPRDSETVIYLITYYKVPPLTLRDLIQANDIAELLTYEELELIFSSPKRRS